MAYNREHIIKRQNRQIAVRELHPEWSSEQVFFELQRKWGITRRTALRDWQSIREEAERAKAEQEGGDDGHEGQSTTD